MRKQEDDLGQYYKLRTEYQKAKKKGSPAKRLALTDCDNCGKEFQRGDKAYAHSIISYICRKCKKKQKTAKEL